MPLENLYCSHNGIQNGKILNDITTMIKEIDQKYFKQTITKNTILVTGATGSGKTILHRFLTNNSQLVSEEIGFDSGRFFIRDLDERWNQKSNTYNPIDNETSFFEIPDFTNNPLLSSAYEVTASYAMKKYLQDMKSLKILLIIPFTSFQYETSNDYDIIKELNKLNSYIKTDEKIQNSLTMVVTKVPYNTLLKFADNNKNLTSDEIIIQHIGNYLARIKRLLKDKQKTLDYLEDKISLEKSIKLLKFLLKKDEKGIYKKINIFYQPSESGLLSNMDIYKKSLIKNIISNSDDYTSFSTDDIEISLSYKAKNFINCILWDLNNSISKSSNTIFQMIKSYYELQIKNSNDIYSLTNTLENLLNKLNSFQTDLRESENLKNYVSVINKFIKNENIKDEIDIYNQTIEYVDTLNKLINTGFILSPLEWSEQMKTLLNYIKDNLLWYKQLLELYEIQSSYEIQKEKINLFNTTDFIKIKNATSLTSKINEMLKNTNNINSTSSLNNDRIAEINALNSLNILEGNNISCDANGKFIITGYFIRISEINKSDIINKYCNNVSVKTIVVNAIHTIFIDGDISDEYFSGVDMIIIARRWEIIGRKVINISGTSGKNHFNLSADDGINFGENGKNGLPGNPGSNGGYFLGIGLYFKNEHNLLIESNGGDGGNGQNGGNGKIGKIGKDGIQNIYSHLTKSEIFHGNWSTGIKGHTFDAEPLMDETMVIPDMKLSYCTANVSIFKQVGGCGEIGGEGGNGGVGGFGGYAGRVNLIGKYYVPEINVNNHTGQRGQPGKGGNGGEIGENGKSIECIKTSISHMYHECSTMVDWRVNRCDWKWCDGRWKFVWKCRDLNEKLLCPGNHSRSGLSNYSSLGQLQPVQSPEYNFKNDLENYNYIIKENKYNKFLPGSLVFEQLIDRIISDIYSVEILVAIYNSNIIQYNSEYNTSK